MNLETPNCRIIEYTDLEFTDIFLHLERCAIGDQHIMNKIDYDLKERPFLVLYEYVPSLTLFDFGPNRSQMLFRKTHPNSRKLFLTIGKILAVDMFLNNFDRLPWLWDNPGNPNNILFKVNLDLLPPNTDFKDPKFFDIIIDNVVLIDTKPICLNPGEKINMKHLAEYLNNLSEILKEFFYEMKNIMVYGKNVDAFEFRCFSKIVEFFNNSTGYVLEGINLFHISLGFLIMLNDILKLDLDDIDKLIEFIQNKIIKEDWADVFQTNAKLLNTNYFKYMLSFLNQLRDENEEVFKFVEECTVDYYAVDFRSNLNKTLNEQQLNKFGKILNDYVNSDDAEKGKENNLKANDSKLSENKENSHTDLKDNNNSKSNLTESKLQGADNNNNDPNQKNPTNNPITRYDHFNFNETDNDRFKFMNDVHNGIYDVMPLDDDIVLEVKKREYNQQESTNHNILNTTFKDTSNFMRTDSNNRTDAYKKYTMEELKDKIKEDELKGTFQIKKKV
jgi:hypothetical protein